MSIEHWQRPSDEHPVPRIHIEQKRIRGWPYRSRGRSNVHCFKENPTEVVSLLALVSCYKNFLPNLAEIARTFPASYAGESSAVFEMTTAPMMQLIA